MEQTLAEMGIDGSVLGGVPEVALAEFIRVIDDLQDKLRQAGAGRGAQRFAEAADRRLYDKLSRAARGLRG
jgi:hypothetical protein